MWQDDDKNRTPPGQNGKPGGALRKTSPDGGKEKSPVMSGKYYVTSISSDSSSSSTPSVPEFL